MNLFEELRILIDPSGCKTCPFNIECHKFHDHLLARKFVLKSFNYITHCGFDYNTPFIGHIRKFSIILSIGIEL